MSAEKEAKQCQAGNDELIERYNRGEKVTQWEWRLSLALLWQIYSRRCSLQIHFRQCGHRCGGSRAKSLRIAWRTAGKVG